MAPAPFPGVIAVDLAKVYKTATSKSTGLVLAWGDDITVEDVTDKHVKISYIHYKEQPDNSVIPERREGYIKPTASSGITPANTVMKKEDNRVLKVDFVDVQQGDASYIETPGGKTILIDGGMNQLFARYLANHFPPTQPNQPKEIDCILISHGDADHFAGLTAIHSSEDPVLTPSARKRLHIHPKRVYHNGLVKRPGKKPDGSNRTETEMLGPATRVDAKTTIITGLVDSIFDLDPSELNEPFNDWRAALESYQQRGPIEFRRLSKGDDDAFDFLQPEGIQVEVLGPIMTTKEGVKGLLFLEAPKPGPRVGQASLELGMENFSGKSASHTINGQSVIFRLTYKNFKFLFAGDLNDQAERILTNATNEDKLRAEVLKVPHHGSADFSGAFLKAVSPVVSVISSGDENEQVEYIHPRATLVGALGRYSRVEEPLIFITELVAFFRTEGWVLPDPRAQAVVDAEIKSRHGKSAITSNRRSGEFFTFTRSAWGIVRVRTDGNRLLVYTDSGQSDLKEAYAYTMSNTGKVTPSAVRQA